MVWKIKKNERTIFGSNTIQMQPVRPKMLILYVNKINTDLISIQSQTLDIDINMLFHSYLLLCRC